MEVTKGRFVDQNCRGSVQSALLLTLCVSDVELSCSSAL